MFKGYRRFITAIAVIIIFIGITFFAFIEFEPKCELPDLVGVSNDESAYKNEGPGIHGGKNQSTSERPQIVPFRQDSETGKHHSDGETGKQTADQPTQQLITRLDLCAQNRMAWWARPAALAAVIGALLLAFTIYLTLQEIAETRRIGEAQVRAYLTVARVKRKFVKIENTNDPSQVRRIDIQFVIRNGGQSPAREIFVRDSIQLRQGGTDCTEEKIDGAPVRPAFSIAPGEEKVIHARSKLIDRASTRSIDAGTLTILAQIKLVWSDIHGSRWQQETGFVWYVCAPGMKHADSGQFRRCYERNGKYEG